MAGMDTKHLARLGAKLKLTQLDSERKALLDAFPGLDNEVKHERMVAQAAHARRFRKTKKATPAPPDEGK